MKTSINLEILKKNLNHLRNAIPSNPQLPILSSIYLKLKGGDLTLASTDLYLGVKAKVEIESEEEFEKVVPGDVFKDLISSFSEGEMSLKLSGSEMVVKSRTSQLKVPAQPTDEYPDFPEINGQKIRLNSTNVEKIDDLISFAASSDQARPVLTTIFLNFSKTGLEVVGTDGFRLSVLNFPDIKVEEEVSLLIPVRAFSEVVKILKQVEADEVVLQVSKELKQVKFTIREVEVFVRLIEGEYPPYQKIIPSQFESEFLLQGEELKEELQRAFVLAKEASNIVEWVLKNDELTIKSSAPAAGSYEGKVAVERRSGKGEKTVAFNVKYILEFLSSVKPEDLSFKMNESLKPVMFQVKELENFKYIVMPFRVNE